MQQITNVTDSNQGSNGSWNSEEVRNSINEDYQDSSEREFWQHWRKRGRKGRDSYSSFKSKRDKNCRKCYCPNRLAFKSRAKWYGYDGKYMDYAEFQYEIAGELKHTSNNHKVYCASSRKTKVLYETEQQANNFIIYNCESIENQSGYAPIRSYYCELCGGWHVTSQAESEGYHGMSRAEYNLRKSRAFEAENARRKQLIAEEKAAVKVVEKVVEKVEPQINEEQVVAQLINEIRANFNKEMVVFFSAYRAKDLDKCNEIHARLTGLFAGIGFEHKELDKIRKRLQDAKDVNIKKLTDKLDEKDAKRQKLIWGIQQLVREECAKFNRAFCLGKRQNCIDIFMRIHTAISAFNYDMQFLKAIKQKLDKMEAHLRTMQPDGAASVPAAEEIPAPPVICAAETAQMLSFAG